MTDLRVTANVGKVLDVFLANPTANHYGYALVKATALPSGNLYPILYRLEANDWIEGRMEDERPGAGRPRRYYRLTPIGANNGRRELDSLQTSLGKTLVYGPHCSHEDCGWIECNFVAPPDSPILFGCRRQASCPHCGPTSPEWPRLSAQWVQWCVERFGTASSVELGARDGMYFNVVATAELVESHPDDGRRRDQ